MNFLPSLPTFLSNTRSWRALLCTNTNRQQSPCRSWIFQTLNSSTLFEKKKKKEFRYTEEDWKKSSPLPTSCLPQSDTAQCAEWDLLGPWFLPQGKLRVCRWVSSFPSYMWCCHKSLFFSHSTLNKVMSCMTKGEKKLRELQIKRSEGIKWIYTYPTTSQTISGSLPMKHWRCLIYKNPQLSHGYPWCPGCLTNTYPHPEADSLWILRWWQQIWKMVSEHTEKTDLDQWARERP